MGKRKVGMSNGKGEKKEHVLKKKQKIGKLRYRKRER
jgi:hypothetical protein